ncbi:Gfo/Idh/MocA family oxidoreductase [uncultured Phocaeicola sp.]|uniref:Gfo/Idh/MocA family oxidoreductase n=1 Tax=uncultured Phocaeicola sp. TaxID=990718 RepID=UPI001434C6C0|nr:Gfo/Idh/MocA family oxidoreductase [uncultured Phocaeicola sp.]GFH99819.1 glycerol-3-phosphate cytidylyltransferase [Bacteroidaceae bacterium]
MKTVITYGTYDLLHQGHINLLHRARALGDYLIVGVTSDSFDRERGKLNVRNNVLERVEAVKATGLADQIVIEDYVGQKIDDIQKFNVDVFAIGSDWEGKFEYLNEYCEVVYLPRTEGISSTQLRAETQQTVRLGVIGTGRIAHRFINEALFVNGVEVFSCYNPNKEEAESFSARHSLKQSFCDLKSFMADVDAVYIASPHTSHYDYAKYSLEAGKHVLCEIPFVLDGREACELYQLAKFHKLVLLEASKTAFCPAWTHLLTLVKSGVIGKVVDVKASLSKLMPETNIREFDVMQAGGSVTELAPLCLMSIVKLLGTNYTDVSFYSKMDQGVDIFTKANIVYESATASMTLGLGVKTEGNLVVSGTRGYVLVPSPWWLTNYFEVCYEDQNLNKKYFYAFQGDGLRYEIREFASMIFNRRSDCFLLHGKESSVIADIIGKYRKGYQTKILK